MPTKAKRWCGKCSQVHDGPCPQRADWNRNKPDNTKGGRGGRPWRKVRQQVFEEQVYLCQEHLKQGKLVSVQLHGARAGVCDHIIPLSQGGLDYPELIARGLPLTDNLQTLCQECSDAKSREEAQVGGGH